MACAVRSCRIEIYRRPDLSFFNLPRQQHLRDEWLDILGIERGPNTSNIKVCEQHFKQKDFCEGKKQLKSHAIPVLKLGNKKSDPIDSDDEFMEYSSDNEPEIIEIGTVKRKMNLKQDKIDENVSRNEGNSEKIEEGRRPSRKAAREAAKKIYNTVRNYMPKADIEPYVPPSTSQPTSAFLTIVSQPRRTKPLITKVIPEIDLLMECHEELLTPVQAEALLKAQLEYNMVMKNLRTLKANNVKIIFSKEPTPVVSPVTTVTIDLENNSSNTLNTASSTVLQKTAVPVMLSTS